MVSSATLNGNYLRVRGEYVADVAGAVVAEELPPRARRILGMVTVGGVQCELPPRARRIPRIAWIRAAITGTTSACAENTSRSVHEVKIWGNYLRVRGEYISLRNLSFIKPELPPRARRIPAPAAPERPAVGTTSACAENTKNPRRFGYRPGNYLRVRGEYACVFGDARPHQELPPRARRIPVVVGIVRHGGGTTSACAENTAQSQ